MARQAVLLGAALAVLAAGASAQSIKLPATLTVTAYDTGSSGFNIAVAVGKVLKDKHGTDVRVLPAGNDVARLALLKGGRAQASYPTWASASISRRRASSSSRSRIGARSRCA
jgi:ABC-type glycerol-3-phosphate transport system substrate-binding protein